MTSDYMSLDDLPESAYEQLKQRLEYADEQELKDLGLPKERIESLMAGREPDAYDVELAFDGIGFVEDDFGLQYKEDISDEIYYQLTKFFETLENKFDYVGYDGETLNESIPTDVLDNFINIIADTIYKNQ